MTKIHVFGDSFLQCHEYFSNSWPTRLSKKYSVNNYAFGGYSNYEIFIKFNEMLDTFEPNDIVIVGWSDPSRFYVSSKLKKDYSLYKIYYQKFYNEFLNNFFQKQMMKEVKKLAEEKKIKTLFLWSFPSGYKDKNPTTNWINALLENYDPSNYFYLEEFENEIKPALFYFSKKETEQLKDHKEVSNFFINDVRPNHIGDQAVHDLIFNTIEKFIISNISGQINLLEQKNG